MIVSNVSNTYKNDFLEVTNFETNVNNNSILYKSMLQSFVTARKEQSSDLETIDPTKLQSKINNTQRNRTNGVNSLYIDRVILKLQLKRLQNKKFIPNYVLILNENAKLREENNQSRKNECKEFEATEIQVRNRKWNRVIFQENLQDLRRLFARQFEFERLTLR